MKFYKLRCGYQTNAKLRVFAKYKHNHRYAHKLLRLVTSDWFVTSAIFLYRRLIGPIVLR